MFDEITWRRCVYANRWPLPSLLSPKSYKRISLIVFLKWNQTRMGIVGNVVQPSQVDTSKSQHNSLSFDLWLHAISFLLQRIGHKLHGQTILKWKYTSVDIFNYHILPSGHKLFTSNPHPKYIHSSQTTVPHYLCKVQEEIRLIYGDASQGFMVSKEGCKGTFWDMGIFCNLP